MRQRRQFDDGEQRREALPPPKPPGACMAHGCPLPGVYTHALTGSEDWLCMVHDGMQATLWQDATERINDGRRALFRLLLKLSNATSGEPVTRSLRESLKAAGRPDLASVKADTCKQLGYGIRSVLVRECKGDSASAPEELRRSTETWASAAGLVGAEA